MITRKPYSILFLTVVIFVHCCVCFAMESQVIDKNEEKKIANVPIKQNAFNDVFIIDPSLISEKEKLITAYEQIKKNPVGVKLLDCLNNLLLEYPNKFIDAVKKQGKVQSKQFLTQNDQLDFNQNKHLIQKILLTKGGSTLFKSSHKITDFQDWSNPDVYKNFTPKVYLKDTNEALISVLKNGQQETNIEATPFYMVLAHELIHAIDFLKDPALFEYNSTVFSKEDIMKDWNLSLLKSDQYGEFWDGRNTEFLAVFGRCVTQDKTSLISELTMRVAENMPIRVPYANKFVKIGLEDVKYITNNGLNLLNKLLTD